MFNFLKAVTINSHGILVDPTPDVVAISREELPTGPAKIVKEYASTNQAHIYASRIVADIVSQVYRIYQQAVRQDDDDDATFETDQICVAHRQLGKQDTAWHGNRKFTRTEWTVRFQVESCVAYELGTINPDIDEYTWCLIVEVGRRGHRKQKDCIYNPSVHPFELRKTFCAPGSHSGLGANALLQEDFDLWRDEMLRAGSPLYACVAEALMEIAHISTCQYCYGGVAHRSPVCERCENLLNDPCPICRDYVGMRDGATLCHERCLDVQACKSK